ncbi:MAG TPA: hypothetical protein VFD27_12280 [Chthoniobacteraceae bacterium]|nr:hypothetical protein [Chthoniobacteraceae bacterium]
MHGRIGYMRGIIGCHYRNDSFEQQPAGKFQDISSLRQDTNAAQCLQSAAAKAGSPRCTSASTAVETKQS